ncbi:MAG: transketolase C-terminal domain-containing protein [Candidatus Sericytochromatia bacterium]|nr:transketolase C-terminal domain-containing protein [Candidatus Sericytochromatia bacterium]
MATIAQAIRMALHYGETHLGVTDIFGEDVGPPLGGVFTATQGLKTAWNSPLDERGIIGMAVGIAMAGGKPVAAIQFADYIFNTIDLLKLAGNMHWSSYGQYHLPLVVMTPVGAGIRGSIYHSHSFESVASHIPGWKIVAPSNARDAYGLMIAAIKEPNPVLYLKSKALMRAVGEDLIPGEPADRRELDAMINAPVGDRTGWQPRWPEGLEAYTVELGKADVVRSGTDVTVVSYSRMLPLCVQVAQEAAATEGVSAEVIDLRTLYPLDMETLEASLRKTGRLLVVNEDTEVTNFGEHLIRKLMDRCFYHLEAPPVLLAGADVPGIGLAPPLEDASVPQPSEIRARLVALARER